MQEEEEEVGEAGIDSSVLTSVYVYVCVLCNNFAALQRRSVLFTHSCCKLILLELVKGASCVYISICRLSFCGEEIS